MYDWLDERLAAARALAGTLGVRFEWHQTRAADDKDIRQCEKSIGVPLSTSHRAFLRRCNGARISYVSTRDGVEDVGNTVFVLGTEEIVRHYHRMRDDYEGPDQQEYLLEDARRKWHDLIPTLDLQDSNYVVSDPHSSVGGEYASFYAGHELGPQWWRDAEPLSLSFEELLWMTFSAFVDRRQMPEFWDGPDSMT